MKNKIIIILLAAITIFGYKFKHSLNFEYLVSDQYYNQDSKLLSLSEQQYKFINLNYSFDYKYNKFISFENSINRIFRNNKTTGGTETINSGIQDIGVGIVFHPVYDTSILKFRSYIIIPTSYNTNIKPVIGDKIYKFLFEVDLFRRTILNFFWNVKVGYKFQSAPYKDEIVYNIRGGFIFNDVVHFFVVYSGNYNFDSNTGNNNFDINEYIPNRLYSDIEFNLRFKIKSCYIKFSYTLPIGGTNNYYHNFLRAGVDYEY